MPASKTITRERSGKPDAMKPRVHKLRLYVAGQTPKSIRAFANLKALCEEHLKGSYQIEVIDLLKHPQLARGDQIVAIPTLVRRLPPVTLNAPVPTCPTFSEPVARTVESDPLSDSDALADGVVPMSIRLVPLMTPPVTSIAPPIVVAPV